MRIKKKRIANGQELIHVSLKGENYYMYYYFIAVSYYKS